MSPGLQIKVVVNMWNVGPVPKVGCTNDIDGTTPVGNTDGIVPSDSIDTFPWA